MTLPWSLNWIKTYSRRDLIADLPAGLTVGVLLIPQGMAYAMLAGVEPIQGLYAAMIAMLVYAVVGTSRFLMPGPVAVDSLLILAVVSGLATEQSPAFIGLVLTLGLMVGVLQILMGIARLGFLANFLSRPVLRGFTTGAPMIIIASQVKHILGVEVASSQNLWGALWNLMQAISHVHLPTLCIGIGGLVMLLALKCWSPRIPGTLVVVMVGILLNWGLSAAGWSTGVAIVGEVPRGLPSFAMPEFSLGHVSLLWIAAMALALNSYVECISLGKLYAEKYRDRLDENQELVAIGTCNLAASFFQGFSMGGSFSRTAVNEEVGARTRLSGWFAALVLILTLLFFTRLFYFLPKAILAAVVIMAVQSLIRFGELRMLWQIKRTDGMLFVVTVLATLCFGALVGLGVGVVASSIPIVMRLSRPHLVELGVMPDGREYRNLERYPQARPVPGILVLRIDASFCFLNASYLRNKILRTLLDRDVHSVVIDASSVNDLDGTAFAVLERIHDILTEKNMHFYIAGLKGPVRDVLKAGGLWDRMGAESFHLSPYAAVEHLQHFTDRMSELQGGAGI